MKSVGMIVGPDMYSNRDTGITIRIRSVKETFENIGLHVSLINKNSNIKDKDFLYLMLTTKPTSPTYKFIKNFNRGPKVLLDLYNPVLLEKQVTRSGFNPLNFYKNYKNTNTVKEIIRKGNYFIVANHRQMEYWEGFTKSQHINISRHKFLIIPTGIKNASSNKFSKHHKVIILFGGFYPWMNPLPFIDAFSKIANQHSEWKLRFLGAFQPGSGFKKNYELLVNETMKKIPKSQFEFVPWQPQKKLGKYFSDVAFAVHMPKQTEEDYYSHRLRLLTILSYGVPILTSGKDVISNLLIKEQAGAFLPSNPKKIESILLRIISTNSKKSWRKKALTIQDKFIKQEQDLRYFNDH